jgi:phage tail protein X
MKIPKFIRACTWSVIPQNDGLASQGHVAPEAMAITAERRTAAVPTTDLRARAYALASFAAATPSSSSTPFGSARDRTRSKRGDTVGWMARLLLEDARYVRPGLTDSTPGTRLRVASATTSTTFELQLLVHDSDPAIAAAALRSLHSARKAIATERKRLQAKSKRDEDRAQRRAAAATPLLRQEKEQHD